MSSIDCYSGLRGTIESAGVGGHILSKDKDRAIEDLPHFPLTSSHLAHTRLYGALDEIVNTPRWLKAYIACCWTLSLSTTQET